MLTRLLHLTHVFRRPVTLGVRAAAFDEHDRIFLVRHTYVAGWYLPGGGVDAGETVYEALARELAEEGNLRLGEAVDLFGVYFNRNVSRRDHVILFSCHSVVQTEPVSANFEIAEAGFFDVRALPDGTTGATRRRIAELTGEIPKSALW